VRKLSASIVFTITVCLLVSGPILADCTNILVSKGATVDGSVIITYSADSGGHLARLVFRPAGDHTPGELVDAVGWEDFEVLGQVRQVAHTYAVLNLMNEHQLAVGETTTGGREELHNPEGILDYDALLTLVLQRCKTAREAIKTIDELVKEYGYESEGETFSISDKEEVWMMEIIGKGPGVKGAVWVACRIPDGCVSAHANQSRIETFPMDDPENWLYSEDVVSFAVEKGYYDPDSGEPFSWRKAYHGEPGFVTKRVCAGRIWSIYRRVAPSQNFSPDYYRGVEGAEDWPLFIKPDTKLSVRDVMGLMRDHFEGTPWDMTKGIDAGPFSGPYRWRGLTWKVGDDTYCWERPISSQQAGFVEVCQSRAWLPDPVGGIYWYTPDDSYTSAYVPFYCGINTVPQVYAQGDIHKFSWESAWWVVNIVSNLAYDRWSRIFPDVQKVRDELEDSFFAMMPAIEETAVKLGEKDEALMRQFLTTYSVSSGERTIARWRQLWEEIITKHIDGFVLDEEGRSQGIGYPEHWLKRVVEEKGDDLRVPPRPQE
jgi:dipeptidase